MVDATLVDMDKKIKKELESMNNILVVKGHCSTIDPVRIHKLRTDIYDYVQKATGHINPRSIERTEYAMKLQTIENKLILGCYQKEREMKEKMGQ